MLNNQISANDTIVSDAYGSAFSILFNEYLKQNNQFNLIVTEDSQQAHKIYKELKYLNKDNPKIDILFFPNLEILPYDRFSAAVDIISRRQEILYKMTHQPKNTLIITSISNTLRKLAPASFIQEYSFILKTSDNFPFRDLQQLVDKINFDKVILSTDSNGRAKVLLKHLNKLNLNIKSCKSFNEALKVAAKFCLIISSFQEGVIIDKKIVLITEADLFPEHSYNSTKVSQHDYHSSVDLKDLTDLKP